MYTDIQKIQPTQVKLKAIYPPGMRQQLIPDGSLWFPV